ncbi:Uu.00g020230.m01.CDS01 [Anthostomella pinea]|uniref:Mediator of RNA polymerase II transcription subunit 4 n=1 Tax=Anthostomella pinea TaxID=933095 RepID=A0AAI8W029_9PEZI|nr:Uu.00g020230.m01.CDS01 [Anthostomella pinea]
MDKKLDSCFDRVEKALATLVDSIAKYNPSIIQVQELGNAETQLTEGLQDLQTHQTNYRRIQELHAATSSFDTQIKDALRLLANTRKELLSTPATVFPDGPSYDIKYDELLSYARRISKTTMPPVGAVNSIQADTQMKGENGGMETAATTPGETPNGVQSQPQSAAATPANGIQQSFDASQQTAISGGTTLPEHLTAHLNPNSGCEFVPWPSEEQVRKGAIASLSFITEQGINPENYDPAEEEARKKREEEERREQEERERVEREERERKAREEQARLRAERERNRELEEAENRRRASVGTGGAGAGAGAGAAPTAPGGPPRPQATQFHFMGDDDDDDDD